MANHSIILAWKIPWTEIPVGLQFMGLKSLVGYSPWDHQVLAMTKQLNTHTHKYAS